MTTPTPSPPLHLGVQLGGTGHHPGAWRHPHARPSAVFDGAYYSDLVSEAERGTLDLVTFDDSFAPPSGREDIVDVAPEAMALAARVAPVTSRIGLVPTVTTTHTEPFHLSKAVATLDHVSNGRAGWEVGVSATRAEADHFGRRPVAPLDELYAEASDAIEVVARLWDSWEDDAVIRDTTTGRYVDRDKLHYVDFDGPRFSVRGPSITPRPPQGQPPVVVRVDADEAWAAAIRYASIVRTAAPDLATARSLRARFRDAAEVSGRDPDDITILADLTVQLGRTPLDARLRHDELDTLAGRRWRAPSLAYNGDPTGLADLMEEWHHEGAVDGFIVWPLLLPTGLTELVDEVVPLLRRRGLLRGAYPGDTLRDTLGLARPGNRYAA